MDFQDGAPNNFLDQLRASNVRDDFRLLLRADHSLLRKLVGGVLTGRSSVLGPDDSRLAELTPDKDVATGRRVLRLAEYIALQTFVQIPVEQMAEDIRLFFRATDGPLEEGLIESGLAWLVDLAQDRDIQDRVLRRVYVANLPTHDSVLIQTRVQPLSGADRDVVGYLVFAEVEVRPSARDLRGPIRFILDKQELQGLQDQISDALRMLQRIEADMQADSPRRLLSTRDDDV